jgi:RNA polymerase-binding protein DksA
VSAARRPVAETERTTLQPYEKERTMPLTLEQIEVLAAALRTRREALTAETHAEADRARAESYSDIAGSVPDTGDDAVADLLSDLDHAEIGRDVAELRAIDAALDRIAASTYGQCEDCGGEIEFERLRANPIASRCFACQAIHEKTFAQPRGSTL